MPINKKRLIFTTLSLIALLYVFFLSIGLLQTSFTLFGSGFAESLIEKTSNPFIGLFIGILATTLIQSSSSTTSLIVALVAAGTLSLENAIPMIMGANVGTSVTSTLVSLGHIKDRADYKRAVAAASVHDFFNILTVMLLFPLEYFFQPLQRTAEALASIFHGAGRYLEGCEIREQ